ncbi:hypothetical protein BDV29DRAFT_175119 [Aspergillus leporis]|uniref:Uncharacterized protein n=1 Tax=Aspergillus leporis TaxID=41062 RepID=A0A5N5X2C6_9EURO|nr:hypothetical protein BDV29DRAFT_175119 [Aspergillus leporis]
MTLSHRMNRMRNNPQSNVLAETFFRCRGLAIRSLSDDLDVGHRRTGDIVIAGILTLLLSEVNRSSTVEQRQSSGHTELFPCTRFSKAPHPTGDATSRESRN